MLVSLFGLYSACYPIILDQVWHIFVCLSLLQTSLFVIFMQCCFWRSNSVPVGLRTKYLWSPQIITDADSISYQRDIMLCALKTWVDYPCPIQFIVAIFGLFLSFIFCLNWYMFFSFLPFYPAKVTSLLPLLSQTPIPSSPQFSSWYIHLILCSGAAFHPTCDLAFSSYSWVLAISRGLLLRSVSCHLHGFMFPHEDLWRQQVSLCQLKFGVHSLLCNCAYPCKLIIKIIISNRTFICCIHSI